jgi:hypothetical protein
MTEMVETPLPATIGSLPPDGSLLMTAASTFAKSAVSSVASAAAVMLGKKGMESFTQPKKTSTAVTGVAPPATSSEDPFISKKGEIPKVVVLAHLQKIAAKDTLSSDRGRKGSFTNAQ